MGKRKNKTLDEEQIKKKIKKLTEKLKNITNIESDTSCESAAELETKLQEPRTSTTQPQTTGPNTDEALTLCLPDEFLAALGEEGMDKEEDGIPINEELASRWTKILNTGLTKEARQALDAKHLIPRNLPRATPSKLNLEIAAAISELSQNRDKRIISRQNSLGKILSCLGYCLTDILSGNINSIKLIEYMSDAAKFATDIFYHDDNSRKFSALAGANKDVQLAAKNTVTDEWLFGKDLMEKIKSAHKVQITSHKIKPNTQPLNRKSPPTQETQLPHNEQWSNKSTRYRRDPPLVHQNRNTKRHSPPQKSNYRRH